MAIVERGVARRWPWEETGQGEGAAASDIGMQVFRTAADDATWPVVLADADGLIVYANHTFHELNGDDAHQITRGGMAALSGISPGAVEDVWRGLRRGEPWKKQFHSRKRRAKNSPCCSLVFPLKSTQGRVTHILGCHAMCEDHDTSQNALRGAQGGAGMDRLGTGWFVTVVNRDERVVFNKCGQLGVSNADVVGESFRKYALSEQVEICAVRMAKVFRTGTLEAYQILAKGAYGVTAHYESWIAPLSSCSQVVAVVMVSREVVAKDMNNRPGASPNEEIGAAPNTPMDTPLLSQRELEVTRFLADGLTNHEIAHSLGIARRTVDHHVEHILTKLGAPNRTSAVYLVLREGLILHP